MINLASYILKSLLVRQFSGLYISLQTLSYHFSVAHQKGLTDEPIQYFAAPENRDLGVVKSIRKPRVRLIIAPFPERQKNEEDFFFSPNSQVLLTTGISA